MALFSHNSNGPVFTSEIVGLIDRLSCCPGSILGPVLASAAAQVPGERRYVLSSDVFGLTSCVEPDDGLAQTEATRPGWRLKVSRGMVAFGAPIAAAPRDDADRPRAHGPSEAPLAEVGPGAQKSDECGEECTSRGNHSRSAVLNNRTRFDAPPD
jgi:hypothetical protein